MSFSTENLNELSHHFHLHTVLELPVQVPAPLLLNQLPGNASGRPQIMAPTIHLGGLDGAPVSWLQPSTVQAVVL